MQVNSFLSDLGPRLFAAPERTAAADPQTTQGATARPAGVSAAGGARALEAQALNAQALDAAVASGQPVRRGTFLDVKV